MSQDTQNLKSELLQTFPYRVELHAHTNPVSGCSEVPATELVRRYAAIGAQGVVITNHALPSDKSTPQEEWVKKYLKDYHDACAEGEKLGIKVYLGMEMRFPGTSNDYLVYGVDEAFTAKAWDYLDKSLHTFYEECHGSDRVIVQGHPFRDGMILADPADLDGIEVFNMHPHHNSRVAMAANYHKKTGGIATGGSDFHHPDHEGQIFACFRELPSNSFALARTLKSGDYILVTGDIVILP